MKFYIWDREMTPDEEYEVKKYYLKKNYDTRNK